MNLACRVVMAATCLASLLPAQPPPVIDRELFFDDPEISGAQLFARWQVHRIHETLEQDPQYLGQTNRGCVRNSAADNGGHEATDPRLFLEPRQQIFSLSSRISPETELQCLRREPVGPTGGGRSGPTRPAT